MTQLIAIDPAALQSVLAELRQIRQRLDAVDMQPRPEWVTVAGYAHHIGRSRATVSRKIKAGEVETCMEAGVRMVRVRR